MTDQPAPVQWSVGLLPTGNAGGEYAISLDVAAGPLVNRFIMTPADAGEVVKGLREMIKQATSPVNELVVPDMSDAVQKMLRKGKS